MKTGHRGFCLRYRRSLNAAAVDDMFAPRELATVKPKRSIGRKMSQKTTCWSREARERDLEEESWEVEKGILFHLK